MFISPGINRNLNLDFFDANIKNIFINLSELWHLSFSKKSRFKNSGFSFVFAKPTDFLNKHFNLDKEVLILYIEDNYFEPRSLDFVDKLLFEFSNRLDKLCIILISKDTQIVNKVEDLIKKDVQTKIIIPFLNTELEGKYDEDFIVNRMKNFFYNRDFFNIESPITSDTFLYGRKHIINDLYGKYKSGHNSGLFGLRKIGKTSVLHAVKRFLNNSNENAFYIDCQDPSIHQRRWNETLFLILEKIIESNLELKHIKIHSELSFNHKNASRYFEKDLKKIYNKLGQKRLLLIFDEIEHITFNISTSSHWREGDDYLYFWQTIRAIYQSNPELFSIIIAGVNPMLVETGSIKNYDNPIYRYVQFQYLNLFSVKDTKEMVSHLGKYMGINFDEEIYTYLTEYYGGHPFLIRQVCSKLHKKLGEKRPTNCTKFFYSENMSDLNDELKDYIEAILEILKNWYPDEYDLLGYLAIEDYETFDGFAKETTMIEHLMGYGLIVKSENNYYFNISAIKKYLNISLNLKEIPSTNEKKWQKLTKSRGIIELKLRKLLKSIFKANFGKKQALLKYFEIKKESEIKRLTGITFETILDKHSYFNDYKTLIIKHWKLFQNIFLDKSKFQYITEHINKYRGDAHAKAISDEDYDMVISGCSWINECIDEFNK